MTKVLSEKIVDCYNLLFVAEGEYRKGCWMRALICYEECKNIAKRLVVEDEVYRYCYMRAVRKEAQLLRLLGFEKKSYKLLVLEYERIREWDSIDKFFILIQLWDLSAVFDREKIEEYWRAIEMELIRIRESE